MISYLYPINSRLQNASNLGLSVGLELQIVGTGVLDGPWVGAGGHTGPPLQKSYIYQCVFPVGATLCGRPREGQAPPLRPMLIAPINPNLKHLSNRYTVRFRFFCNKLLTDDLN